MLVHVIIAAGSVASVQIECEAVGRGPEGWLVVTGYDHHLAPILTLVHDDDVLEILVEGVPHWEMDLEQGLMAEWAEAA